ncbi:MAG: hypothetical protein ACI814_002609 [Mariniblastus sp.]|jgi:hypothetical protein
MARKLHGVLKCKGSRFLGLLNIGRRIVGFVPFGDWDVECVLINDSTVFNCDSLRILRIMDGQWQLLPQGQTFKVVQMTAGSAVLKSNDETYFANFKINGNRLELELSRSNHKQKMRIEAEAITADVFVASQI